MIKQIINRAPKNIRKTRKKKEVRHRLIQFPFRNGLIRNDKQFAKFSLCQPFFSYTRIKKQKGATTKQKQHLTV